MSKHTCFHRSYAVTTNFHFSGARSCRKRLLRYAGTRLIQFALLGADTISILAVLDVTDCQQSAILSSRTTILWPMLLTSIPRDSAGRLLPHSRSSMTTCSATINLSLMLSGERVVHRHQPTRFGDLLLHLRGVAAEKSSPSSGSCRRFNNVERVTSALRSSTTKAT